MMFSSVGEREPAVTLMNPCEVFVLGSECGERQTSLHPLTKFDCCSEVTELLRWYETSAVNWEESLKGRRRIQGPELTTDTVLLDSPAERYGE